MNIHDLLSQKKTAVLDRWINLVVETYPPETARFLKKEKNRFANPVGSAIAEGIEGLYGEILAGIDVAKASSFLDHIIRIRAIQDFAPSQALGFVLSLKKAIREELKREISEGGLENELAMIESEIDQLLLLAFDIYMECREKISEIRVNEVKDRTFALLKRANLVSEVPAEEPKAGNGNNNNSSK